MNWLVGFAFAIPVVLINGFLLMMAPGIIGLGGPFAAILACGFLISLIPGFLALLIKRSSAPPPPTQKRQGGSWPPQPALEALLKENAERPSPREERSEK